MRAPNPQRCLSLCMPGATVRRVMAVALALGALAFPSSAQAQFVELEPGTRIRLRAPSSVAGQLIGVVIARPHDSLTVSRSNARPVTLPLSALTSLEISRGKSHRRGAIKGALWGGGVFLVLGVAIPIDECADGGSTEDCVEESRAPGVLWTAASGAFTGALIGAIVGAESWDRAALPLRITARPLREGGVQLGFRWR